MTRLMKELRKHGVIYTEDEYMERHRYSTPGCEERFVAVTDRFILTVWSSDVLPPQLHIYDRDTYEFVGSQETRRDRMFNGALTWSSYIL